MTTQIDDMQVGDIGTRVIVTINDGVDPQTGIPIPRTAISTASVMKLYFRKPGGVTIERDAELLTDGSDAKIVYVTVSGDIDRKGTWSVQGYIQMPGWSGRSNIDTFPVGGNL